MQNVRGTASNAQVRHSLGDFLGFFDVRLWEAIDQENATVMHDRIHHFEAGHETVGALGCAVSQIGVPDLACHGGQDGRIEGDWLADQRHQRDHSRPPTPANPPIDVSTGQRDDHSDCDPPHFILSAPPMTERAAGCESQMTWPARLSVAAALQSEHTVRQLSRTSKTASGSTACAGDIRGIDFDAFAVCFIFG